MSTAVTKTQYTPEDLLTMPDGDRYELVDGQLVERTMSLWSSYVAGKIHRKLGDHVEGAKAGWVLPEGAGYRCFPDEPGKVRRPDVSFIRKERMPLAQASTEGFITVAPDLAVEVVSPNDIAYELQGRVYAFLEAG